MTNFIIAFAVFISLLTIMLISVYIGRKYGQWQLARSPLHKLEIVTVAEGAVFALLGLLVAFTFTGAYDRFESRKTHIIEEANSIDTAYLRLDLLGNKYQAQIKDDFKKYLYIRISLYKALPYFQPEADDAIYTQMRNIQLQIWHEVVVAAEASNNPAVIQLVINSVNNMFEIANLRLDITQVHLPLVIFILLIGLATLSALLAGYSTAGKKISNSFHILCYVIIMASVIYVIIDLEYPRHGIISVNSFDNVLIEVLKIMH